MAVNDSEMNRMQQDAIRRVREMQARALQYQSGVQSEARRSNAPSQQPAQQRQAPQSAQGSRGQTGRVDPPAGQRRESAASQQEPPRAQTRRPEPPAPRQSVQRAEAAPAHRAGQNAASTQDRRQEPPQQRAQAASPPEPPQHPAPQQHATAPSPSVIPGLGKPVSDIFAMLFKESDRTLILALLLVLSEEKADPSLLFALLYIAL